MASVPYESHGTERGAPEPLGAFWDGRGVNFALFSEHGTGVVLCLFDDAGRETRFPAAGRSNHVWHVYVRGAGPGQRYGWRVHGPYAPRDGHRFNGNKLLVDPYARAVEGAFDPRGSVYGYARAGGVADDLTADDQDDAAAVPKCVVVDERFDWGDDRPPRIPWPETIIYEAHVKGFTMRHPGVPEPLRGTFLGLASDAALSHWTKLGVTSVELLPVHARLDEPAVSARGLTNYWGYNTLAYVAAEDRFASRGGAGTLREMKQMVKRLHARAIEVFLDVVYNHTCEGDRLGPTVSLRGIDNSVFYRLNQEDKTEYVDLTGCGNTLDASHPQALKLITDSLRYWVTDVHVDGFRFDLAPALARDQGCRFDARAAFLATIHQDPVLSRVKLIAEPWDLGEEGYRLGGFPVLWSEWNDRFRDTVRRFWRGERKVIADLGYRLTGSSDLFAASGRSPRAGVNFVAAHDGFTLRDSVSYERKHNESNGEDNGDGRDGESSQNCGVEGDTSDAAVAAKRRTLAQSMLATVLLSQGTPMLQMGDELWRTQEGNSNAFCHDSELTWVDWSGNGRGGDATAMLDFAVCLLTLRKRQACLRRSSFLRGEAGPGGARKDITWLRHDGGEMAEADWASPARAAIAFCLAGVAKDDPALLILMNGEPETTTFLLPASSPGGAWRIVADTNEEPRTGSPARGHASLVLGAGSLVVMVEVSGGSPPNGL
ncbi:MAG: glycogen debranching protein GlgX [Polyangiaceae bacterium]